MSLNLLYISEDYSRAKVHHQLISSLCDCGVNVTVFSIIRMADKGNDKRKLFGNIKYDVIAHELPKEIDLHYKLSFAFKRKYKYNALIRHSELNKFDAVHACTLFSEGIIAYDIKKEFGIPYTVAVRATDINLYLSKMPHLWLIGRKILKEASKVIFITPIIQKNLLSKFAIKGLQKQIVSKSNIIPNGIDSFWFENIKEKTNAIPHKILYIGRFDKNKNVERLIKAVLSLKIDFPDIELNLIGGGDSEHNRIMKYCEQNSSTIHFLGRIDDKNELLKQIRNNEIFAMVSHSETFGLVYLEAMSQGLPVLYSRGQGIDESFPNNVGECAYSYNTQEIANKLRTMLTSYNYYSIKASDLTFYSWPIIAQQYIRLINQ